MTETICAIPGCGRPTAVASGKGKAQFHCRYHVQLKSRHGSFWHRTYRASDLRPYREAAVLWLEAHQEAQAVYGATADFEHLLAGSGAAVEAHRLRGRPVATRARIAYARLREAGIPGVRLLETYLAVAALIEDDWQSDRSREFRNVQAAKAIHRLASGTHKRWEIPSGDGHNVRYELHAYPRSSGLVIRRIGATLEKTCESVSRLAQSEIIALKTERSGEHPSHRRQAPTASKEIPANNRVIG